MTTIDVDAALNEVLDHEYDPPNTPLQPVVERPAPYIAAVPVSRLFADSTYQRDLDTHRVDKMAADFQIALVGIIEVSLRDGGVCAILDGQHRWGAVKANAFGSADEDPHVPCRIHTGLTVTEEADLYHRLNTTRRSLTGWDRWVARRGAGDPAALAIEACAARNDIVIGMHAGTNVLRATKACENVVALGGIALLDEVLGLIRKTWPDDQAGFDAAIVYGLGHVLDGYTRDELDIERLVATLSGIVPRQLTARAAAVRELHKGTMDRLAAHVIVDRYNATKGGRLQPFFERVRPVSKTKTAQAKSRDQKRQQVLAWAKETNWSGRQDRVTPKLVAAYEAAHGRGENQ